MITTKDQGTADYSVQLVQPKLPAKQGYTYEVTFDAYASADRAVGIAIKHLTAVIRLIWKIV